MEKRQRVLLFGNSVILGSIGSSLQLFSQYEVKTLLPPWPDAPALKSLDPDVILFDIEATQFRLDFALFDFLPDLRLIGLSSEINRVLVWSGRQLRELSILELVDVIDEQAEQRSEMEEKPVEK
jgi:hypothetical protein